jgi:hypothetical protein
MQDSERRSAHERVGRSSRWLGKNMRLSLLLACLGLVVLLALGRWSHPGAATPRVTSACDAYRSAAATVRIGGLLALRAGLLAVMPRAAQIRPGGVVTPAIVQSGGEPERVRASRQPGGLWPGGVELRRSSRASDFLVADALRFETAEEARRYLHEMETPACNAPGIASQAARPQSARNRVSYAFPGYVTYSIYLVRGPVFYRIVDDRPRPAGTLRSRVELRAGLATVDAMACALPATGCSPSRA